MLSGPSLLQGRERRVRAAQCTPARPPRSRCAGGPASLWRHSSPAGRGPRKRAGCVGANRSASETPVAALLALPTVRFGGGLPRNHVVARATNVSTRVDLGCWPINGAILALRKPFNYEEFPIAQSIFNLLFLRSPPSCVVRQKSMPLAVEKRHPARRWHQTARF